MESSYEASYSIRKILDHFELHSCITIFNKLSIENWFHSSVYGFQLLKIVQKYGDIEKFDLLFHHSGPLAGKSRGYGFVTYKNERDSERALSQLNGLLVGRKCICVKHARAESKVGSRTDCAENSHAKLFISRIMFRPIFITAIE